MYGISTQYRSTSDGRSLSRDLAHHIARRYYYGKIAVVADHPSALLNSTYKAWLTLIRQLQHEKTNTLDSRRIIIFMKDKPDVLADELVSMANADQAMRNANIEGGSWDASIDKANTNRLKEIIATDGWPTISEVGHNAALAAWLIAQHADHDPVFQARCLELMKQLPTDEIILANLAYLEDRVRVSRGQPQLYGTQFDDTQSFGPKLVEDEEHLDERRASVGLGSSSEYKQRMEELYKPQGK